jgi:hypothetical protein
MSTLHLLPTWLVPEARWQRTGILSSRPVHSRARVNTMAKNKYSTYFRNTHPSLSQSEVRKSTATRQINYSFSMWCMHAHLTYVQHIHTHIHTLHRDFAVLARSNHSLPSTSRSTLVNWRICSWRSPSQTPPPPRPTQTCYIETWVGVKWRHSQTHRVENTKS